MDVQIGAPVNVIHVQVIKLHKNLLQFIILAISIVNVQLVIVTQKDAVTN